MEQTDTVEQNIQTTESFKNGLVLYTDGGARPNPGYAGYGVHGYHYDITTYAKPIGLGSMVASTHGYKLKDDVGEGSTSTKKLDLKISDVKESEKPILVSPNKYVDMFGTVSDLVNDQKIIQPSSNNRAEVDAANAALRYTLETKPQYVNIYADSKYVVRGVNEFLPNMIKRNWMSVTGNPIANMESWKELNANLSKVKELNIDVNFHWIEAHSGHTGNERADKLATIGVFTAMKGQDCHQVINKEPDGFWKYSADKHPFLSQRHCYFNTLKDSNILGEYYLGDHGKSNELFCKKTSDTSFSVVRVEVPDNIVEMIRNYQSKIVNYIDSLFVLYLDKVYNPDIHSDLNTYGEIIISKPYAYKSDLSLHQRIDPKNDVPLTYEFNPPRLALRSAESLTLLSDLMDKFLSDSKEIEKTDITSVFYEHTIKPSKPKNKNKKEDNVIDFSKEESNEIITKLKPEINVGCAFVKVNCNYNLPVKSGDTIVTLTLGIDMLDRNALKRLEDMNPRVYLITWSEGPNLFRYATIIQANKDIGIWASVNSNLKIVQ